MAEETAHAKEERFRAAFRWLFGWSTLLFVLGILVLQGRAFDAFRTKHQLAGCAPPVYWKIVAGLFAAAIVIAHIKVYWIGRCAKSAKPKAPLAAVPATAVPEAKATTPKVAKGVAPAHRAPLPAPASTPPVPAATIVRAPGVKAPEPKSPVVAAPVPKAPAIVAPGVAAAEPKPAAPPDPVPLAAAAPKAPEVKAAESKPSETTSPVPAVPEPKSA